MRIQLKDVLASLRFVTELPRSLEACSLIFECCERDVLARVEATFRVIREYLPPKVSI